MTKYEIKSTKTIPYPVIGLVTENVIFNQIGFSSIIMKKISLSLHLHAQVLIATCSIYKNFLFIKKGRTQLFMPVSSF